MKELKFFLLRSSSWKSSMIVINDSIYLFTGFTGDGDEGSETQ